LPYELAALEAVLAAWPGGLLVVSHDEELLAVIGTARSVELPGCRELGLVPYCS
jgi:ATPase subunit of ABC transporter with duplicated ATPase domains